MRTVLINSNLLEENVNMLKSRFPGFCFRTVARKEALSAEEMDTVEVLCGLPNLELMSKAKNLRMMHSVSAGVDYYLDDAERLFGGRAQISNAAGVYGIPISEHILALMLAFSHRIHTSVQYMAAGHWSKTLRGVELHGATVGVLGLGDIGLHLVQVLKPFACEVLAWKRSPATAPDGVKEMLCGTDGLETLLRRSDYVCICLPGTPQTQNLMDAERLGMMKPGAVLINIGRGNIVDSDALVDALSSGHLGGAGLDVTNPEPLPEDHPLWKQSNCIITPHISGQIGPYWEKRSAEWFAVNLQAYLDGKPLPGAVDRVNKY